jgi:hypothetical protein
MTAAPHALAHFVLLDQAQQRRAIRQLKAGGAGDHEIARLTGLHVEQVRRALADRDHDGEGPEAQP